jgi:autotransporter translocation and assembly factor TamB
MCRLLRRAIVAVAILVVATIGSVLIVSQTRRAHELVRARVVDLLTQTYQGHVGIGAIEGSFLGDLEIHDIVVSQRGEPILTVPLARVRYALFPLVARSIRLTEIEVMHPRVHLARSANGAWNVASALEVRNPPPRGTAKSGGYSVSIHRLEISDADIKVELPSGGKCRLTNTNLEATANLGPASSLLTIQTVDSRIGCPDLPQILLHAEIAVHQFRGAGTVDLSAFSLKTRASEIDASATVYDLAKMRGQGVVQVRKLAASDLDVLFPDLAFARDVEGAIKISGDMAASRISAAIIAGNSRTILEATTRASGTSYDYEAQVSLSGLKMDELLARSHLQLPRGTIHGTMRAQGNVRDLADLSAEADLHGDAMAIGRWHVGNLAFRGKVARQVATIDAALANGTSHVQLRGAVGLKQNASYQLALAMDHIDLRAFAGHPASVIPTDLNGKANLRGVGIDPKTAEADGTLQWSRSIVGPVKVDRGGLRTVLSQGLLRIRQASIEANDSSLKVQGTVRLSQERRVFFNYSFLAGTLSPWLELAGERGHGHLELVGTIAGNLDQLRAHGSSLTSELQFGKYSAQHARLIYDLVQVQPHGRVRGEIELTAADVNAAARFKSLVTTVHLSGGPPQSADVSCKAIDNMSRPDQIRARLIYQPGALQVNLATLSLATAGGEWNLRRAAEFRIQERALQVRHFELVSGPQSLTIEGQASNAGMQNLRVSADRVSLAVLAAMYPRSVPIEGLLSAHFQLSGDAAAPVIDATAAVDELNVSGLRFQGLDAKAAYAARKALFDVALRQDGTHSLRANGTIPLRLAWSQRFQAEPVGDMDFHVASPGIDIAVLQVFTSETIKKLKGELILDVSAAGPPKDLQPHGYVDISGATFLIKPLNVDVTNATVRVDFDRQQVRVVRLFASAGDGTLSGRGTIDLERYSPRRVNVAVSFDKWPAIATQEYRSIIAGTASCSGSLDALRIGGSIESLSGLIRPDISLSQKQSLKPDETIHVSRSDVESRPDESGKASLSTSTTIPSNDVTIDLGITIDRDNWIKTDEAQVELQGTLRARKPAGGPVDVIGTLHTVRGSVSMVGKRFDLVRGDINFVGGAQIDPALDILAQDRVQNYLVSANITGPASKPNLSLSSVPSLEQSDILSMVMFGRPVNQLNGSQQQNLQKQAAGIAASQAGRAIADSLGLEDMGLTTTETGGVGVGRYVTQNIYVSASQETTDPRKRRGSVSYYLTPRVNINTSTSTGYGNQIELQWHKDY